MKYFILFNSKLYEKIVRKIYDLLDHIKVILNKNLK